MEINKASGRIHPLMAAAAVSVILVSVVGIAAITGMLPNSHSSNAPVATLSEPADAAKSASASAATDAKLAADSSATAPEKPAVAPPATHKAHAAQTQTHHSQPRTASYDEPTTVAQAPKICASCGRVESVQPIQQAAKPSGLGVVAGAVLGGVLGNHVGNGNGRALATVAGAVGGGYAGNEVEKRTHTATSYQVHVRMEDGSMRTFPYASQPGWNTGDRVQIINGSLTARG